MQKQCAEGIGWVTRRVSGGISKLTEMMGMEEGDERLKAAQGVGSSEDGMNESGGQNEENGQEGNPNSTSQVPNIFALPFFAPLVCKFCSEVTVVRLSSCNAALNTLLAPEVQDIQIRRRKNGQERSLSKKGPDTLQLLLCLTFACAKSCAFGTFRPLELYIIKVAFGPNGFLNDAVGYSSIGEIFEFVNDGEDWEGVAYF